MIVITAPTSQTGRQVLADLLDGPEPVRVIARDPSRLPQDARDRVEVVQGAHDDPRVVTEAFDGVDAVFWLVPPNPRADSVEGHYLDFTRPACAAIGEHGVKRVVAVSTLGRGIAKNAGHLTAALAMDELIESTGVNYRALRMPFFMENLLGQVPAIKSQGTFYLASPGDRTLATCATRDIAATAARLLRDDSWRGQEGVPVVGPDDLSPDGMARVMSEVLERPVRFQEVSLADYKQTLLGYGMSDAWAQGMVDMAKAQNEQGVYDQAPRDAGARAATGFRQWCEEALKPAVLA